MKIRKLFREMMVKFQFERLEANENRREQKIKKLFRETAKFQLYELEADDLRREQMHFLWKESRIPLRSFLLLLSKSCTYQNPAAYI